MIRHNAPAFSDYSAYIGIPYREPDSEPYAPGLNCWELCEKIMIEMFNIWPPKYRYKIPGKATSVSPVFVNELKEWQPIPADQRSAGDLVLLNVAGYPMHLGIMIDSRRMIHTLRGTGSACEYIDGLKWSKRVAGFYRWSPAE